MSSIAYRKDIDGLRSLAILPVVANHAGLGFAPGGFVGVDIFFVISGFLITSIIRREIDEGQFSIVNFYERRVRRIIPALVMVLLACFAVGWFILLPADFMELAKSSVAALLFSSNFWFYRVAGDYFATSVATAPLLHTWSLAVEEQFYLFFPLLLAFLAGRFRQSWWWVIAGLSLASLALSVAFTFSHPTANFYLLPTRAWELGLGALVAIGAVSPPRSQALANAGSILGIVLIALSVALIDETMPFPGLTALPPCLGAALVIWSGQAGPTAGGRALSTGLLVWFGLISYSLYLWHWPVMVAARIVAGGTVLDPAIAWGCIALSVLLGWLSWRFVERPFRNARSGFWQPRRRIFLSAGAASGLVAGIAALVFVAGGFAGRVPAAAAPALEVANRTRLEQVCMARKPGDAPCLLGAEGRTPDFVVWGDSHAGALLPGLDALLRQSGQSVVAFTKSACLPVPGLWRVDRGVSHGCDRANADALEQIRRDFPEARIVLVARWALVTQSGRAEGEEGRDAVLARSGEQPRPGENNAHLVEEALLQLARTLRADGRDVTVLASVPEQGRNVPRLMAQQALLRQQGEDFTVGQVTPAEYDRRNAKVTPILARLERDYAVRIVNVRDIFCADVCEVMAQGQLLYRDDDHLSPFGARWLLAQALPELAATDRAQP